MRFLPLTLRPVSASDDFARRLFFGQYLYESLSIRPRDTNKGDSRYEHMYAISIVINC